MEPQKVNVIIYAARNLQPKRGSDVVCKPYVVFGIGKEKFKTECAKGSNPTWNEESTIQVTKSVPLVLTVTDREEVLGAVTVPLTQIASASPKRRWEPLTKKNVAVGGELCFDCWVTSYQKKSDVGAKWSLKTPSFIKDTRTKRRTSMESSSVSLNGSRSMENLYSACNTLTLGLLRRRHSGVLGTSEGSKTELFHSCSLLHVPGEQPLNNANHRSENSEFSLRVPDTRQTIGSPSLESRSAPASDELERKNEAPEITGISPKFGPVSGGTRITLRGRGLGISLEDVLSLSVCGCDLLPTFQYQSPTKLTCVTRPWSGCGPVVMVTKSGGRGASTVNFSFEKDHNDQGNARNEKSDDVTQDGKGKVARSELLNEITRLRRQVLDLSADNERLRKYIDRIVLTLMEKIPHVLENLTAPL